MPQEPMIEQDTDSLDTLSHDTEQVEGQEDAGSQEGQDNTQQQQQPSWNPQEWAMNFRGQQVYPKDRQHLVNLAQKGWGYEAAMEQINQERQRIAQMQGEMSRYTQLDEALKKDPQFAQRLMGFIQEYNQNRSQGTQQQGELPPQVLQIQQELEDLKSWKQSYAEQQASAQIDQELAGLAQQYSNFDWQSDNGQGTLAYRVLKHAYDNNITNLHSAFRDLMFDQVTQQTKIDTMKQQKEQQQKLHRQGVIQGSGPSANMPASKGNFSAGDSYNDLAQKALAALGG